MAFNNNWISAAPLYKRAEEQFRREGHAEKALYAEASQIPAIMGTRPLSKAEAFIGLKRYDEALKLIDHFIALSRPRNLRENLAEGLAVRAQVLEARGDTQGAIQSYLEAINNAQSVSHWHSLTEINAELAKTYERAGLFDGALRAIDAAIHANRQTPDEVYFVPQNLAIKAEIEAKSGHRKQAESLYQRGSDMLDTLLKQVPTPMVERELISELSDLYSGYFNLLADDGRLPEAFQVIERAHGRIETQSLEFDVLEKPHQQTAGERTLNRLEFQLLDASGESERKNLLREIYDAEQSLSSEPPHTSDKPVPLSSIQRMLGSDEILIEYVLSDSRSSALAITRETVHRYELPSKASIEGDCQRYSRELKTKRADLALAHKLYDELLPIRAELQGKSTAIVVADGGLQVLPFAALNDARGKYLISTMNVVNIPSATAWYLLRSRDRDRNTIPYLGAAAWTQTTDTRPWVVRAITGPQRSALVPLPESKREIETAASFLPQPDTLLLGTTATRKKFLSLPLSRYDVLHLSLHGYADMEYPDRSALVFAPSLESNDSGFLQAREIRSLHLNARLVTLSACNTAAGPIYGSGAATIVNAFIEAGAQSVISTLWDVDDRSGSKLMRSFYRYLAEGRGKAEALREAELEFVNSGESPYYWANFQMVGDAVSPLFTGKILKSVSRDGEGSAPR